MQSTIWKLTVLSAVIGVGFVAVMQAQRSLPTLDTTAADTTENPADDTELNAPGLLPQEGEPDAMSQAEPPAQLEPQGQEPGEPEAAPGGQPQVQLELAEPPATEPPDFSAYESASQLRTAAAATPAGAAGAGNQGLDFRGSQPVQLTSAETAVPGNNDPFGGEPRSLDGPEQPTPASSPDFGEEPPSFGLQPGAAPQLLPPPADAAESNIRRTAMDSTPASRAGDDTSADAGSPFFDEPAAQTPPRNTEPARSAAPADFGSLDDPFSGSEPAPAPAGGSATFPDEPATDVFPSTGGTQPQFSEGASVPLRNSSAATEPRAAEPAAPSDAFPPLPGETPAAGTGTPQPRAVPDFGSAPAPATPAGGADSDFPGFPEPADSPAADGDFPAEPVPASRAVPRAADSTDFPGLPAAETEGPLPRRSRPEPDFGDFSPEPRATGTPDSSTTPASSVPEPVFPEEASPEPRAVEPRSPAPRATSPADGFSGFPEPLPAAAEPREPAPAGDFPGFPEPAAEPAATGDPAAEPEPEPVPQPADGAEFPPLPGFGPTTPAPEPRTTPEPAPAAEPREPSIPAVPALPGEPAGAEPRPATPADSGSLPGFGPEPVEVVPRRDMVPSRDTEPAPVRNTPAEVVPGSEELTGDATVRGDVPRGQLRPRLQIEKIAPTNAVLGKPLIYHIVVRNSGQTAARQVTVEDRIPAGTELTGTIPQAELADKTLTWKLGTIAPGEERKIAIRVVPRQEGQVGSVATVNFVSEVASATVITAPKLSIELQTPESVHLGDRVPVRFRVRNDGTGDASGVLIRDLIPRGLSHVDGNDLEYEVGNLPAGGSREVTLTLTAAEVGEAVNRAVVTADGGAKAETSSKIDIKGSRVSLSRRGPKRRYVDREGTWTNVVTNTSRGPVAGARVVEQIPEGFEFVEASANGQYDPSRREVS
ncbi:MAG: DUF11 domain-containing protein [Planctomycetaceae bacterium]|nr:DUF11 domain-containing protein [Planctomycetaceae bacterium]